MVPSIEEKSVTATLPGRKSQELVKKDIYARKSFSYLETNFIRPQTSRMRRNSFCTKNEEGKIWERYGCTDFEKNRSEMERKELLSYRKPVSTSVYPVGEVTMKKRDLSRPRRFLTYKSLHKK